jgi:c-di-GMP-binding flagellar brake protein YcgR
MNFNKGWLERREFERVKDLLKVAFYPVSDEGGKVSLSDDYKHTTLEKLSALKIGGFVQAMTEDISSGGMSIISDTEIKQGQKLIIDLFLPRFSKPLKLLAEAKHIEKNIKGAASYRAGLKIISISRADLTKIENRIIEIK